MSYMYNFTLHEYVYKHVHIHSQKYMHIPTYDNHTWRNHFLCTCIVSDDYGSGISCNSQWFALHDDLPTRQRNPQLTHHRSHSLTWLCCRKPVFDYVVHAGVGSCLAGGCARCAPCHIHGCMGACGAIFMSYCAYAGRMDICWLLQRCRKRYPMPMILALSEQFAWACGIRACVSVSIFSFSFNTIMLCSQQSITSDQFTITQY